MRGTSICEPKCTVAGACVAIQLCGMGVRREGVGAGLCSAISSFRAATASSSTSTKCTSCKHALHCCNYYTSCKPSSKETIDARSMHNSVSANRELRV